MKGNTLTKGISVLLLIFVPFWLFGEPYNTPTIDGVISISPDDWDEDELVGDDPIDDSYWTGNEFRAIYLTYDATNLYIGLEFVVSDNAMILYIESGIPGGVVDFNSTRGYSGAYPRNIVFPDTFGIDLLIGSWNGEGPYVYLTADSTSSEITSLCRTATGDMFEQEIAIPWSVIYPDAEEVVFENVSMGLVGVIAGGDDYGAADAVPDNPTIDGGEGPHLLTEYITIPIDANGDGIPDFAGESINGLVNFNDTTVSPPYPVARIDAVSCATGEIFATAYSSTEDGSYMLAGVVEGEVYDIVARASGFHPDTVFDYTVVSGENRVDFTLEPYTGRLFGTITPDDVPVYVYAMMDTSVFGFPDTAEGEYEITHLPDGIYNVFFEPLSVDYVSSVVESVEVLQGESVELDVVLERAGVIREAVDATGDDYGPGWYMYPTDVVFVDAVFDIEYVKIRDTGDAYQFEVAVGDIPGKGVVDWSPYYPPLNLQKIDIYIDCHRGGATVGLPNRNVTFAATDAWDFAISVDGWWKGVLASNGQDIFSNFTQDVSSVSFVADTLTDRIWITVDKSAFVDNLGYADTSSFSQWDILVLMLGHDGSGVEGVRYVNSGTSNQWQFNGGADGDIDPNVIDIVAMPGTDAYGNPKEPGRSQEEMLDYTVCSPVVLEAAKSTDIIPPTISYSLPAEIPHLAGTPGVYIEVYIEDDVDVYEAMLFWRNVGEEEWHPIPFGYREERNMFVGDIPFDDVKPDSFEFFFVAADPSGNLTYDPKDYPDTAVASPPAYPYSTLSANPTRVIPSITDVDTSSFVVPVNTISGEHIFFFPDGAMLTIPRSRISSAVDTIYASYTNLPSAAGTFPDISPLGQYRTLVLCSEKGQPVLTSYAPFSFHYFETTGDESSFTLAKRDNRTDVWVPIGGRNAPYPNTINCNIILDEQESSIGLFEQEQVKVSSEPVSDVIISPNPFSPNADGLCDETNITVVTRYDGQVDIDIFDISGNLVLSLARGKRVSSGRNENIIWDGCNGSCEVQPVGVYLVCVRFTYIFEGNEREARKNKAVVIVR